MTAPQRRTVTVKIGGDAHRVEIIADVEEPDEVAKIAEAVYRRTQPPTQRPGMGFASQTVERGPVNRHVAGDPIWNYGDPVTAKAKDCTHDAT